MVVLLTFLLAAALLLRALRRQRIDRSNRPGSSRSKGPYWFFAIVSGAALWFMVSSMILRFHAVEIDRLQVVLIYLWPQPPLVINISELVDVKLMRAGRNCGHLEVATRQQRYLSVPFRKCDNAEALIKLVALRGQ